MGSPAIDVIFENGVFRPVQPVGLPEGSRGKVYLPLGDEPIVTKTSGVCGGRACVAGTRITVWGLAAYRSLGLDEQAILAAVPGLRLDQLSAALRYADEHAEEIETDLEDDAAAES